MPPLRNREYFRTLFFFWSKASVVFLRAHYFLCSIPEHSLYPVPLPSTPSLFVAAFLSPSVRFSVRSFGSFSLPRMRERELAHRRREIAILIFNIFSFFRQSRVHGNLRYPVPGGAGTRWERWRSGEGTVSKYLIRYGFSNGGLISASDRPFPWRCLSSKATSAEERNNTGVISSLSKNSGRWVARWVRLSTIIGKTGARDIV